MMKTKILIILIILISLGLGGVFVYENILRTEPENESIVTKLNVIEVTNLSLKEVEIDQNDISSYRDFIKNNKQHQRPTSMTEIRSQIVNARAYLETNPSGKTTDDLREKIIEELNMGFLLDGLNDRELIVTTVASQEYEEYFEKELLFKDPQVGTFSVLLLIPNLQKQSYPAIIGLHGHGNNGYIFRDEYFGKDLAKEGFVVIIPSFRAMFCDKIENNISKELISNGFTLMGLRVYEVLLLTKYLKYKDFVDETKIGIMGHSGGSATANLVSRISPDIEAGIYDMDTDMLNQCGPEENRPEIHCETVPSLGYYNPQINDRSTMEFPYREFEYNYPGQSDKQEIIKFFKEKIGEGALPISDAHAHFYYGNPSYIDEWIIAMDKNNVRKTVLGAPGEFDVNIQKILDGYIKYPDRTYPLLGGFNIQSEDSVSYLENQLSIGKWSGIGEIFMIRPQSKRTQANHPVMLKIYEVLIKYDVPIFAHYEIHKQEDVDALYEVLENYPKLKFVWDHLAGHVGTVSKGLTANELDSALTKYPNLYIQFDTMSYGAICITPSCDKLSEDYRLLFEKYPDRFMVGSDIDMGVDGHFDSAMFEYVISTHRRLISQLTSATAKKIGYENLEKLMS